jgi:hypothetical protein
MKGGSWTNDISWMRGYGNVLAPIERASALFGTHLLASGVPASDPRYRPRCSICWPVKPAATATGARASGRITAPSSPAALARPPARRPDRRAARTEGEGRRLRHRRVVSCGEMLAGRALRSSSAGQRQELRPARWAGAWSGAVVAGALPVPGVADLGADAAQVVGELGGVLVTGQGHGAWRRSYRDPGRAAAVPGDLAS